jgi:hypothetical protein
VLGVCIFLLQTNSNHAIKLAEKANIQVTNQKLSSTGGKSSQIKLLAFHDYSFIAHGAYFEDGQLLRNNVR